MRALLYALAMLTSGCALPDYDYDGDGWSTADGDCDDYDPLIHRDAEELLDDGIDQDCDGADIIERVSGNEHVCERTEDGRVWCFADDGATHHQLDVPDPREGARYIQIAAGDFHTCALDDAGFVTCWGDDTWSQSSGAPDVAGFVRVDASGNASFGERVGGAVFCWGKCPFPAPN